MSIVISIVIDCAGNLLVVLLIQITYIRPLLWLTWTIVLATTAKRINRLATQNEKYLLIQDREQFYLECMYIYTVSKTKQQWQRWVTWTHKRQCVCGAKMGLHPYVDSWKWARATAAAIKSTDCP